MGMSACCAAMSSRERRADRGHRIAGEICRDIGRELREARIAAGLSQARVGRVAGHSQSAVSRIERGRQRPVSVDAMSALPLAATHHNRSVLRQHRDALRSTYPLDTAAILKALRARKDPGASGIVVL